MKNIIILAGLIAASAAAAQPAAQPAADPASLYGVRENIEHIDISPDGSRVVFMQPGPGRETIAYVYELAGGGAARQVARTSGSPERLRWCNFAANDRLVCQIVAMDATAGFLIPFARLISVDLEGGNPQLLGERRSQDDARIRQNDGAIIDWLGGSEGAVLMAREYVPEAGRVGSRVSRTADGLSVDRIDVRTARATRVEAPNRRAGAYISDGRGTVRIMSTPTVRGSTGQAGSRIDHFYRPRGGGDWRPLGSHDELSGEGMMPLAVDAELDAAYVLRKLNGRFALYRVKLDESLASELVYANEQVDVDNVVFANRGARVIGVTFADERRRIVYFDQDYAAIARGLSRAIPNLPLIDFGSTSSDGSKVLVHAGSDTDAGRYYVYDRATRSLNELLMARPPLENRPAATVRAIAYPAADGVPVPAYLTLPPGRTDARGLPAVVFPHGGPAARDEWGFDWIAQYLRDPGLCGAAAQLSRLGRLWRRLAAAQRLPELAHLDRRHHRRRALARRPGRRREPDGDRRLVLWRLCRAAVGGGRARPVPGGGGDRAGHRPAAGEGGLPPLYGVAQRDRIYRQRPAHRRGLAAAPCRGDPRAGAAVPRRPRPQRQRDPFAADGRCAARRRAAERAHRLPRPRARPRRQPGEGADARTDRHLPADQPGGALIQEWSLSPSPLVGEGWGGGGLSAGTEPVVQVHPTPNPSPSRGGEGP